jgi:hypothetical protein
MKYYRNFHKNKQNPYAHQYLIWLSSVGAHRLDGFNVSYMTGDRPHHSLTKHNQCEIYIADII